MSEILSLVKPPSIDPELTTELKRTSDQVEAGEVTALLIIKFRPDHSFGVLQPGKINSLELVGALTFAVHDAIKANVPTGEKP